MKVVDVGWVTVESAADSIEVSPSALSEWCRAGSIDSFRDGPVRYVRIDDVRQHIYGIKGRPQTSLHTFIASSTAAQRRTSEARISDLQSLIRERELAS